MDISKQMQHDENIRRNIGVVKQQLKGQIINSVHTMMLYHIFGAYLIQNEGTATLEDIQKGWGNILKRKFDDKLKYDERNDKLPIGINKTMMMDMYKLNLWDVFADMERMLKPVSDEKGK